MRSVFVAASLVVSSIHVAHAVVLSFDDVPGGSVQDSVGNMPVYKGFEFSQSLDWVDVKDTWAWNFGAHSGDFALLSNSDPFGEIKKSGGGDFTFDGLWIKLWGTPLGVGDGNGTAKGDLVGFKNDEYVWAVEGIVINGNYQYIPAQAGAIDRLYIGFPYGFGPGAPFLVDDVALNASTPVPEASVPELALVGGLLISVMAFRFRRETSGNARLA
ncbi:MAG: hypothetical protein EOO15_22405 [Chitinophagaceae bacterium]|nr:MAG: hypothetical protein EOO15_22405 [Chitinophagaceae bacterium]